MGGYVNQTRRTELLSVDVWEGRGYHNTRQALAGKTGMELAPAYQGRPCLK